jgi:hypothetical protein
VHRYVRLTDGTWFASDVRLQPPPIMAKHAGLIQLGAHSPVTCTRRAAGPHVHNPLGWRTEPLGEHISIAEVRSTEDRM